MNYYMVLLSAIVMTSWEASALDSLDLEYNRIQTAITLDSGYSRLYYMDLSRSDLRVHTLRYRGFERALLSDTIPKTGVPRTYRYRFIYLPMQFEFDNAVLPLVPLLVEEISEEGERGPEGTIGTRTIIRQIFDLKGFLEMRRSHAEEFSTLVADLRSHHLRKRGMPLGSKISNPAAERTAIAEGNRGYFQYTTSSEGYAGNPHSSESYSIDATWSSLKVSLGFASAGQWLGVHSFGFEIGFGDRILNLLSVQSPYLSWGGRLLVFFEGKDTRLDSSFFFDLRILGRSPINTQSFLTKWKLDKASPVVSFDRSLVNVTSGVTIDLHTGRPFSERLPFLSLYYSGGPKNFDRPFATFDADMRRFAYFSTIQWEAALSYFWYLDQRGYNSLRLDIGAGAYNIWLVELDTLNKARSYELILPLTNVKALLAFDYLHDSQSARFGIRTRIFDNRFTFHPWLKVYRSEPHEVRLEFAWLTRVLGRSVQPWEVEQGSILYVRYRYGL